MNKENISKEKEYKLNINYLSFIVELKNSKLNIDSKNKEKIKSLYSEIVDLKFSNIKRVNKRNNLKEINSKLDIKLKELNISKEEYKNICEKVISIDNSSNSRYF